MKGPPPPLRAIAAVALLLYGALLFLSALPDNLRAPALRLPASLADALLRSVAIRGGVAVFHPQRERITEVPRNDCIYVRGIDASGGRRWLEPPSGRCVTRGFRPALPDVEWMLRSLLTGGESWLPPTQVIVAIGDFFCHAPREDLAGLREVELLWTLDWFHIDTREEGTTPYLYFRWRCDPPALLEEERSPALARVRSFLGAGAP